MSLAYDAANIINRPFATVLGSCLAGSLGLILFFGVITQPFGFMFGIPSRKYVLTGSSQAPRALEGHSTPLDRLFSLLEHEDEEGCQELALCLSHGGLRHFPSYLIKLYSIGRLINLDFNEFS